MMPLMPRQYAIAGQSRIESSRDIKITIESCALEAREVAAACLKPEIGAGLVSGNGKTDPGCGLIDPPP